MLNLISVVFHFAFQKSPIKLSIDNSTKDTTGFHTKLTGSVENPIQ